MTYETPKLLIASNMEGQELLFEMATLQGRATDPTCPYNGHPEREGDYCIALRQDHCHAKRDTGSLSKIDHWTECPVAHTVQVVRVIGTDRARKQFLEEKLRGMR